MELSGRETILVIGYREEAVWRYSSLREDQLQTPKPRVSLACLRKTMKATKAVGYHAKGGMIREEQGV